MTQKNRTDLATEISQLLPDNVRGYISASDVRTVHTNSSDSNFNLLDENSASYNTTGVPYTLSNTSDSGNVGILDNFAPSNPTGTYVENRFGVYSGNYNAASFRFHYVNNGSTGNYLSIGLINNPDAVRVYSNGELISKRKVTAKTGNFTATLFDSVLSCDASAGPFTGILPTTVGNTGVSYTFIKSDSSANAVIVSGLHPINGDITKRITSPHDSITVIAHSGWSII